MKANYIIILLAIIGLIIFIGTCSKEEEFFMAEESKNTSAILFNNALGEFSSNKTFVLLSRDDVLSKEKPYFTLTRYAEFFEEINMGYINSTDLDLGNSIPVFISPTCDVLDIEKLISVLKQEDGITVLASVNIPQYDDFHEDYKEGIMGALRNPSEEEFMKLNVDCWQCVYGASIFSDTSYFSIKDYGILFGERDDYNISEKKTIMFLGDMMFDRGVEYFMLRKGFNYPFENIPNLFKGLDLVIANLEGPINKEATDFTDNSLMFSFDKRVADILKNNNIDLVSLANNHTLNTYREGLQETEEILTENNISFVGDPVTCESDLMYEDDDVIVYAFNKTFPSNCSDAEIISNIKKTDKFFIAYVHWGEEYEEINSSSQQELAHALIDAGVDLVIGGHPHVVQNIEEYGNKLIFYSLGNFIFDQYFSEETQEGLGVFVELSGEKYVIRLIPFKSVNSQVELMDGEERQEFLNKLSEKSEGYLAEKIKNGEI